MSRGIRDLRDMICVSRLTIRDSDEEIPWGNDDEDDLYRNFSDGFSSGRSSRQSSAQSRQGIKQSSSRDVVSPDSGIGANGNSGGQPDVESVQEGIGKVVLTAHPPSAERAGRMRRKRKKKTKTLESLPQGHELPKQTVLPPVRTDTVMDYDSSSSESVEAVAATRHGNFDEMLSYLDATVMSEWLSQANASVTDLATWCHTGDNFVQFAHFWLSDFADVQKQEIFTLEVSILMDHLSFAFTPGRNNGRIKQKDLKSFMEAVFREYPAKLFSSKGAFLFLDILSILSSERHSLYKKLLADVKVSTRVKQHAQYCLAIRSFSLVSVWSAVVNFYRRLLPKSKGAAPVHIGKIGNLDADGLRVQQAIRCGYVDVVNYLVRSGKVSLSHTDGHQKTLVFSAVMHNKPDVLRFLLSLSVGASLLNKPADTGNTPLHAAANTGSTALVGQLLAAGGIHVDARNPQCEGATPLHLATMHGHCEVVKQLLAAKADVTIAMGDLTAISIATDFGHDDIVKVLRNKSS